MNQRLPILAIDAVGAKHGGAAQIATAIVRAAGKSDRIDQTVVFVSRDRIRQFELPTAKAVTQVAVSWVESSAGRMAWLTWGLSRAAARHGATHLLTLGGGGLGPASSATSIFIQQSLPFSSEASTTFSPLARVRIAAIRRMMSMGAARARNIVVQTDTMAELVACGLGLDRKKIHVVRPGIPADVLDAMTGTTRDERRDHMRVLYVGNSSSYKNLPVVERALDALHAAGKQPTLAATIESASSLGSRKDVEALGTLDRQRLIAEYRRATCLVMPSLIETVGLPLLEAMALSVPIVAADRPYARETCGAAALYFDPCSAESLASAIARVDEDDFLRQRLIDNGRRRAAEFAAGDAYKRLIDVVLN